MALFGGKKAIGLDFGQSSVKLVQVSLAGGKVQIDRQEVFDARREGILDEQEMFAGAAAWLKELGLAEEEFCVGLPQFLTTTQLSDFPPTVSGDELQEMVTFETVQLAGLSDEAFRSDYHVMAPEFGRKNPVLIGICRQSVVDERAENLSESGLRLYDLAMNGMAAANALFFLHPEVVADREPQLVLDIGVDSSTLLVIAAGEVLYAGSLMFGGTRFDEALANQFSCSAEDAEKLKPEVALDPAKREAPLMAAARVLENEIRNSLEHWRAAEREEIAHRMVTGIWLCGGSARMQGLTTCLSRHFGCDCVLFGPRGRDGAADPRLATALGIALQGVEAARVTISLCPPPIRWVQQRRRRFGYLVGAAAVLVLLTAVGLFRYRQRLETMERDLADQIRNLEMCEKLIPRLEENQQMLRHHEKMLVPIVEKANRAGRYLRTIDALAAARGEEDWFIYLADQFSYEEGKPVDETAKGGAAEAKRAPSEAFFPGAISSLETTDSGSGPTAGTLVTEIGHLSSMIVAGHSPRTRRDSLEAVKVIRTKINDSGLFRGADLLPKPERVGREEEIFRPWMVYMQRMAEEKILGPYVSYMFRLPFIEVDVYRAETKPARAAPKPTPKPAPQPQPTRSAFDDEDE
ncbi:MAG: pilus assembly protein PilM [Lentisphaeria bacterium]|nr:pilus assembly protein PilM [Lentisphaeria bacterium]